MGYYTEVSSPPSPHTLAPTLTLPVFTTLTLLETPRTQYLPFGDRLTSLCMMSSRPLHVVAGVRAALLCEAESYSAGWMDHRVFTPVSADGPSPPLRLQLLGIALRTQVSTAGRVPAFNAEWDFRVL